MKDANFYELMTAAKNAVDAIANASQREQEQAAKLAHKHALAHEALSAAGAPVHIQEPIGGPPVVGSLEWRIKQLAAMTKGEPPDLVEVIDAAWRATGEYADKGGSLSLPDYIAKMVDKLDEQAGELRAYKAREETHRSTNYATPLGGPLGAFVTAYGAARGQRVYFADREALRTAWAETVEPLLVKAGSDGETRDRLEVLAERMEQEAAGQHEAGDSWGSGRCKGWREAAKMVRDDIAQTVQYDNLEAMGR